MLLNGKFSPTPWKSCMGEAFFFLQKHSCIVSNYLRDIARRHKYWRHRAIWWHHRYMRWPWKETKQKHIIQVYVLYWNVCSHGSFDKPDNLNGNHTCAYTQSALGKTLPSSETSKQNCPKSTLNRNAVLNKYISVNVNWHPPPPSRLG